MTFKTGCEIYGNNNVQKARDQENQNARYERDEHETLLDVYMRAMETVDPAPVAEAA